jgi:hypothetical protein
MLKLSTAPGNPSRGNTLARCTYGATRLTHPNTRHVKVFYAVIHTDSTSEERVLDTDRGREAIPA